MPSTRTAVAWFKIKWRIRRALKSVASWGVSRRDPYMIWCGHERIVLSPDTPLHDVHKIELLLRIAMTTEKQAETLVKALDASCEALEELKAVRKQLEDSGRTLHVIRTQTKRTDRANFHDTVPNGDKQ